MGKNKKPHVALIAVLIAVFAFGAIGIGVMASRVSNELQLSMLTKKNEKGKIRRKTRRISGRLVAQALEEHQRNAAAHEILCSFTAPEKPEYKGEFISREIDATVDSGGLFEVSLYIKNTGNVPWFGDASGCKGNDVMHLGTARDRDSNSVFYNPGDMRWVARNRIAMAEARVDPEQIATFTFSSYAPNVADIFREYFQPVVEGKQWLERKEETAHVDIYIGELPWEMAGEYQKRLTYLGKTGQISTLDLSGEPVVEVDISEQKMLLKFGDTVVREYLVSTGTFNMPTPLGTFKILNKQELRIAKKWPHYHMPKWQGFTPWGHGLHSLPYLANDKGVFWEEALNHIGQRVSHGCIRLLPDDAEDLYNLTNIGMKLVVHN